MRSFEQRKAEIFRRSENRIKKRKKNRNRIIAGIIPLFFCVVILSVIYLPDKIFIENNLSGKTDIADNFADDAVFSYISVEVKTDTASSKNYSKEKDVTKVESIYNLIQASFESDSKQDQEVTSYVQATDTTKSFPYTIIFSAADGKTATYTLDGNKIIDETSQKQATLTDEQLLKLQKSLGLITTQEETK